MSLIENNYLKVNQKNVEEYNINRMTAINNDNKCNCCSISSVQKVKYQSITKDAHHKWQYHIINIIGKIR